MPVVVTGLVEATRNRLRYLLTDTAVSPPIVDQVTLSNQAAVTPDLQTDVEAAMAGDGSGVSGSQLRAILRAGTDGFPVTGSGTLIIAVGGIITVAQARALLNSDDPGGILANFLLARATVELNPRTGTAQWAADMVADGVSGDPTVIITVLGAINVGVSTAVLDIFIRDTRDL